MKILMAIIIVGLVCMAGGVGYILANGFDIPDAETWMIAIKLTASSPLGLLESASGEGDRAFFEGVFASVLGASVACVGLVFLAALWAVSPLVATARRASRAAAKAKKDKEPRRETHRAQEGKRGPKISGLGKLKQLLKKKSEGGFVDGYADLEVGEAKRKEGLHGRAMAWVKGRLKSKPSPVVIRSSDGEEIVLEAGNSASFEDEIRAWYKDMRAAPKDDPAMIERARKVSARASQSARNQLTEEDPLNGEFMLRMLDSLAAKKPEIAVSIDAMEEVTRSAGPEVSAFSKAIEDVMTQGVGSEDDDEPTIDLDAEDADDEFSIESFEDEDPDSEFAIEESVGVEDADSEFAFEDGDSEDETFSSVQEEADEDGSDGAVDSACESDAVKAIKAIISMEEMSSAVDSFEAEWEDDMADPEMRREQVESAYGRLQSAISEGARSLLDASALDLDGDEREVDWLREHVDNLEEKKSALLESIAPMTETTAFDEDDEDVDFGGAFGISDEIATTAAEDEIIDAGDTGGDEIETEESLGDIDPEDGVQPSSDEELVSDALEEEAEQFHVAEEALEPVGIATSSPDLEEPEHPGNEQKSFEPRDVTIGELSEVEQSGDLLYNWGYVTRGAGAAEAKISHSILAKDGLKRRVVGIVHLIAGWRLPDEDESRRLYIVMRYVPEGVWKLEMEEGVKMVDEQGNFVQVKPELIHQPEIESGTLLVHFYGPGAPEDMLVEQGNVVVTTTTLSMDVLKRKMTS